MRNPPTPSRRLGYHQGRAREVMAASCTTRENKAAKNLTRIGNKTPYAGKNLTKIGKKPPVDGGAGSCEEFLLLSRMK